MIKTTMSEIEAAQLEEDLRIAEKTPTALIVAGGNAQMVAYALAAREGAIQKGAIVLENVRLSHPELPSAPLSDDARSDPEKFAIEFKGVGDVAPQLMEFQKQLLQDIADITGVTYEQVTGRLAQFDREVSLGELQETIAREKSQAGAPPRRLSSVAGHPWYDEKIIKANKVGVRFNGTDRKGDVMEYDADAGFIRVHIRDNKGNWKKSRGRFITIKLNGEVVPFWK